MAVVINLSDPGAVPGDSTNSRSRASEVGDQDELATLSPDALMLVPDSLSRGRNRIDEGVKGALLLGMVPALSGQIHSCQRQLCCGCSGCVTQSEKPTKALTG